MVNSVDGSWNADDHDTSNGSHEGAGHHTNAPIPPSTLTNGCLLVGPYKSQSETMVRDKVIIIQVDLPMQRFALACVSSQGYSFCKCITNMKDGKQGLGEWQGTKIFTWEYSLKMLSWICQKQDTLQSQVRSPWMLPFLYAPLATHVYSLLEAMSCGCSIKSWWND
ncbi:cellulose synthase-like protein E6 [Senna tora]|uniref:Cellulose synthase-like protein E6 n=1 Tax=Senna tora TaxID=362788 RepID=A0A834SEW2_9FABA|nr:cellulose synthase-like protein E6 [Senna tora]